MKLSHLSLAIVSAIALTACGGGGSDNTQPDPKPTPDPNPEPTSSSNAVVDPTGTDAVVQFQLDKKSSVGQSVYIRREKSTFFINDENKGKNSDATNMYSVPLERDNPHLTNFQLARVRADGDTSDVIKLAYSGSLDGDMANAKSLQGVNLQYHGGAAKDKTISDLVNTGYAERVDIFTEKTANNYDLTALGTAKNGAVIGYQNGVYAVVDDTKIPASALSAAKKANLQTINQYLLRVNRVKAAQKEVDGADSSTLAAKVDEYNKVLKDLNHFLKGTNGTTDNVGDYLPASTGGVKTASADVAEAVKALELKKGSAVTYVEKNNDGSDNTSGTKVENALMIDPQSWIDFIANYGVGVVDWSTANINEGFQKPTNNHPDSGLVSVSYASGVKTIKGSEDKNTGDKSDNFQQTRIFGHFYLNPADDNLTENDQVLNSYRGAVLYTGKDGNVQVGALAQPLDYVQYGRVTSKANFADLGADQQGNAYILKNAPVANKGGEDTTDFYFARGTYATSLDDMAALNGTFNYEGHAVLWGVDNSYLNKDKSAPNSLGIRDKRGLGNFVKATLDTGAKTLSGSVYNVFVNYNNTKNKVVADADGKYTLDKQDLITFSGKVTGNSVVGEAVRVADEDKGDFRASFFGKAAQEIGGSFNSTTLEEKYADAKWGGVFGAKKVESPKTVIQTGSVDLNLDK